MVLRFPPLAGIKAFYAAGETGRFRAAAEELGITESAVSHQIKRLEVQLGVRLFERRSRESVMTPLGAEYFAKVRTPMRDLIRATEELRAEQGRESVVLTMPTSLAALWFIPRLAAFNAAHPDVVVQLIPTNRICNFDRERIDIGVRYGSGQWQDFDSKFFLPETCFPVASQDFLDRYKYRDAAELLQKAKILINELHPEEWKTWCDASSVPLPPRNRQIWLESSELILQATLEGMGVGMGRTPLVSRALQRKELLAPFGKSENGDGNAYYLVSPSGVRMKKRVRTVFAWLSTVGADSW